MSVMDDVAALRGMADEIPTTQVRQMQQDLLELIARIRGILGNDAGAHNRVIESANRLGIRLESAAVACVDFNITVNAVADNLQQIGN